MRIRALTYALHDYIGGTIKTRDDNKVRKIKAIEKEVIPGWVYSKRVILVTNDGQEIVVGDTLSQGVEHETKFYINDDEFVLEPPTRRRKNR